MNLIEKQKAFPGLLCLLFLKAKELGYEITLGEAYRPPEMAQIYFSQGKGILHSLHTSRLAIDLNLFKDGKLLSQKEDYAPLGKYWESLSTAELTCAWGGTFNDADHFSIAHEGRK